MIQKNVKNNVLAFSNVIPRRQCFSYLYLTVTLTTGGTSSLNNSYIQVTSDTRLSTGSTQYTICPCSDDICRIKFDFEVGVKS